MIGAFEWVYSSVYASVDTLRGLCCGVRTRVDCGRPGCPWRLFAELFLGVVVGCKEAFFNIVFGCCGGLVLGLVWLLGGVLGVSFDVDVSSGSVSVLGASVLCGCGGFWGTER